MEAGVSQIDILDPKREFDAYLNKDGFRVSQDIEDIEKRTKELVDQMNSKIKTGDKSKAVIIIDEMADAFTMSRKGKALDIKEMVVVGEYKPTKANPFPGPKKQLQVVGQHNSLEKNIASLLQKGRSSGVRMIAATQRPSSKTISGDAKVNFPVQVCFKVQKSVDSKVVIDEVGAESLAGFGEGLVNCPEYLGVQRFQSFWKNA